MCLNRLLFCNRVVAKNGFCFMNWSNFDPWMVEGFEHSKFLTKKTFLKKKKIFLQEMWEYICWFQNIYFVWIRRADLLVEFHKIHRIKTHFWINFTVKTILPLRNKIKTTTYPNAYIHIHTLRSHTFTCKSYVYCLRSWHGDRRSVVCFYVCIGSRHN